MATSNYAYHDLYLRKGKSRVAIVNTAISQLLTYKFRLISFLFQSSLLSPSTGSITNTTANGPETPLDLSIRASPSPHQSTPSPPASSDLWAFMKRETQNLKQLLQPPNLHEPDANGHDEKSSRIESPNEGTESVISESPSLKSDEQSSGIWPPQSTSPSTILLSQYSMLGAGSLSEWQKALEVRFHLIFKSNYVPLTSNS